MSRFCSAFRTSVTRPVDWLHRSGHRSRSVRRRAPWLFGIGLVALATSCAPGTDGILIADAQAQEVAEDVVADGPPIVVELPKIPVSTLR